MIVIKLQGGLGNQMFQYALGKKLELKKGKKVFYDFSYFTQNASRPFELILFSIKLKEVKGLYVIKLPAGINVMLNKIKILYQYLFPTEIISQKTFAFDDRFLDSPDSAYLEGYWQTELYFSDIREELISDFKFCLFENSINTGLINLINDMNSISIHIRRGDYIADTNNIFKICDWQYYASSINLINSKVINPHFIIFSDDPQWCLENVKMEQPFTIVTEEISQSSFTDLYLMTLCKHNIIANSSFSWWGAWLNKNKNKIVIGPKIWFSDKSIDTKDIMPDSWIRI